MHDVIHLYEQLSAVFFMNWTRTLIACFLCAAVIVFINYVLRTQSNCPAPQECPPEVVEDGSDTTQELDTPNTRVRSYSDAPIPPLLQEYAFRVFFPRGVDRQNEKYTLIIQTYKRVKVLEKLLAHYCNLERVDKILVLWNDLQTPIPQSLKSFKCALPLVVIREKENRMTNRFRPRPEIKTDGGLHVHVFLMYFYRACCLPKDQPAWLHSVLNPVC